MGGPQILTIEEMTSLYLSARGREASVQSEPLASGLYDTFRSGINLVPDHAAGTITWEDFLRPMHRSEPPV